MRVKFDPQSCELTITLELAKAALPAWWHPAWALIAGKCLWGAFRAWKRL
jgi:hypothetical protein